LEDRSDASFLGMLLMLLANVRLDWKVIARYKHSSLFGLVICNEEKKFYDIDTLSSKSVLVQRLTNFFTIVNDGTDNYPASVLSGKSY